MPIMIWIAIIIMLALEHWIDFGILMAIQFINAFLGWWVWAAPPPSTWRRADACD
jgi:hypothetical protein